MPDPIEALRAEDSPISSAKETSKSWLARQDAERWHDLWIVFGSGYYLWVSFFTFRGVPFLLGGDQVYFWLYAQRMISRCTAIGSGALQDEIWERRHEHSP